MSLVRQFLNRRHRRPYIPAFDAPAGGPIDQPWTVEAFIGAVFLVALLCGMFLVYDGQAESPNAAEHERLAKEERQGRVMAELLVKAYQRGQRAGVQACEVAP